MPETYQVEIAHEPPSAPAGPSVVTIVGLGFIGASLGLALRRQDRAMRIIGHDCDPSRARQAQRLGAVDRTAWNLLRACEGADIIVLALPPDALRDTLEALGPDLRPGCLITDTATVKGAVLRWAEDLPPHVAFVGGDPIVRSPGQGLEGARADLFEGRLYCLTPAANTLPAAVHQATQFVQSLGAQPYFLDAEEHDGLRAAVEHIPALFTALLLREVARSSGAREMRRLRGQWLIQARALMDQDASAYRALCLANGPAIAHWSRLMRRALREAEGLLEAGDDVGLGALFDAALQPEEDRPSPGATSPRLWRQWLGMGHRRGEEE